MTTVGTSRTQKMAESLRWTQAHGATLSVHLVKDIAEALEEMSQELRRHAYECQAEADAIEDRRQNAVGLIPELEELAACFRQREERTRALLARIEGGK